MTIIKDNSKKIVWSHTPPPSSAVLQECLLAKAKMEQGLGLFSEVGVEIDVTQDPTDETNEGFDITMKVKEPRRFTGGVHTLVGNNDGSLMVNFKVIWF